jgi:hypothetical protein
MTLTEQYKQYVQEWIKENPAFSGTYEDLLSFDEWVDKQLKEYKTLINVQNPDKSFFPIESLEKQIAINQEEQDEFTIEFANYINRVSYRSFDGNWYLTQKDEDIKKTTEELLELFKKEKGL